MTLKHVSCRYFISIWWNTESNLSNIRRWIIRIWLYQFKNHPPGQSRTFQWTEAELFVSMLITDPGFLRVHSLTSAPALDDLWPCRLQRRSGAPGLSLLDSLRQPEEPWQLTSWATSWICRGKEDSAFIYDDVYLCDLFVKSKLILICSCSKELNLLIDLISCVYRMILSFMLMQNSTWCIYRQCEASHAVDRE